MDTRERVLKLVEIFEGESDEEHPLSITDIINHFESYYDITFSRDIIKKDMEVIVHCYDFYGIDFIGTDKYGAKLYCKLNRKFENYQLRMLIDAIQSGRFITQKDSKDIVKKIKSLTSIHMQKKLENRIFVSNKIVCDDTKIKYYINDLHEAVREERVIQFKYEKYTHEKRFELKNDGKPYTVEPYGVVWQNGFYYLVGYSRKHKGFINFRIDRMLEVRKTEEKFRPISFELVEYMDSCFNMYPGKVNDIKLKFHNHLINAIIDYFGKNLDIRIFDKEHFILKTKAAMNKGLIRWILNWGSDVEVLHPQDLITEVKKETRKMYLIYHGEDT